MKSLSLFLIAFLLLGCATTHQGITRANNRFVGKNLDEFIVQYGIPHQKYELNSGDWIYLWNSKVLSYQVPTITTVRGNAHTHGAYSEKNRTARSHETYSETVTTSGGGSIDVFCNLRIHTKPNGQIISIKADRDTLGKWTTSRCAEIFKKEQGV